MSITHFNGFLLGTITLLLLVQYALYPSTITKVFQLTFLEGVGDVFLLVPWLGLLFWAQTKQHVLTQTILLPFLVCFGSLQLLYIWLPYTCGIGHLLHAWQLTLDDVDISPWGDLNTENWVLPLRPMLLESSTDSLFVPSNLHTVLFVCTWVSVVCSIIIYRRSQPSRFRRKVATLIIFALSMLPSLTVSPSLTEDYEHGPMELRKMQGVVAYSCIVIGLATFFTPVGIYEPVQTQAAKRLALRLAKEAQEQEKKVKKQE